ncbi:hypothetical protein MAAFP003_2775, partial [Mycobacterium ahvazicum]
VRVAAPADGGGCGIHGGGGGPSDGGVAGTMVTVCGNGDRVTVCGGGAFGGASVVGIVTGLRGPATGGGAAPFACAAPIIDATMVPCASQSDSPSPPMM